MNFSYPEYVQLFKALADETRLKIIELLSNGEMCACELLQNFKITQPTLSYHMKILCDSGIVQGRREGAWMYYRKESNLFGDISRFLEEIS
jgi:ArsR family transcriptional regulator